MGSGRGSRGRGVRECVERGCVDLRSWRSQYIRLFVQVDGCVFILKNLHVCQVTGDNKSVIAHERFAGCAHSLFAVRRERYI